MGSVGTLPTRRKMVDATGVEPANDKNLGHYSRPVRHLENARQLTPAVEHRACILNRACRTISIATDVTRPPATFRFRWWCPLFTSTPVRPGRIRWSAMRLQRVWCAKQELNLQGPCGPPGSRPGAYTGFATCAGNFDLVPKAGVEPAKPWV
jgi:hypothetical protein